MSVYVDDMYKSPMGEYRGMKMSHLIADSTEELLKFVDKIGVQRKWIQKKGTGYEHFDISISKRDLAVKNGAIEVSMRELAKMCVDRDKNATIHITNPNLIKAIDDRIDEMINENQKK